MWWKLGGLGFLTAALIFLLMAPMGPMGTISIKVDLPPNASATAATTAAASDKVAAFASTGGWAISGLIVFAILCAARWLARRIVRSYRKAD